MYDKELALEILSQIYQASRTILERFKPVYYGRFQNHPMRYLTPDT